jgi:hypothetical protein
MRLYIGKRNGNDRRNLSKQTLTKRNGMKINIFKGEKQIPDKFNNLFTQQLQNLMEKTQINRKQKLSLSRIALSACDMLGNLRVWVCKINGMARRTIEIYL